MRRTNEIFPVFLMNHATAGAGYCRAGVTARKKNTTIYLVGPDRFSIDGKTRNWISMTQTLVCENKTKKKIV